MDNKDINELILMCNDAIHSLKEYEKTSSTENGVFDKIRAVGVVCLDGEKLSTQLKNKIPMRLQLNFQKAVFSTCRIHTLSGGVGKNKTLESYIECIKSTCQEILSTPNTKNNTSKVFYSWQASLPNATNRSFIKTSIEIALKEINREFSIESRIILDSDTTNVPGSPDIINTILEKIDNSDVFIADVSIVDGRMPNPNVMFELGYAMKALGDKKIIMLFNSSYGLPKELPFDLGFKRQMIYEISNDITDKASERKILAKRISKAIEEIAFINE